MCFMHQGHCFDWLFLSKPVCLAEAIKWLESHCLLNGDQIKQTVFWSSRENKQKGYKICYIFIYKKNRQLNQPFSQQNLPE